LRSKEGILFKQLNVQGGGELMKKAAFLSAMLVFVFGATTGIVIGLNDNAQAIDQCAWQCLFRTECSLDTGPECTHPNIPYLVYRHSTCAGGPLNCPFIRDQVIGCWNGVEPCRPVIIW
jgi:hypothetical protein